MLGLGLVATLVLEQPSRASSTSTPATAASGQETATALVAAAQAAYERGVSLRKNDPVAARRAFEEAAQGFERARSLVGETPGLWLNLGNAQLQAGRIGPAILSLRSAARLAPADPRIAASLTHARSLQRDRLVVEKRGVVDQLLDARHALSPETRRAGALILNALFWALLGLRLVRQVPLSLLIASGAAALLAGATLVADVVDDRAAPGAVLLVDDAVLRRGNGDGFDPAIAERLGQGVEMRLLERRPGWYHVRLSDGAEGWFRDDQVAIVGG